MQCTFCNREITASDTNHLRGECERPAPSPIDWLQVAASMATEHDREQREERELLWGE